MVISYLKYASLFFKKNWDHPIYVVLYITDACNFKCKHCFYWKNLNKKNEISIKNAKILAKSINPCLNLSLTGGEPFLRKDLPELVNLFIKYSGAKIISIPTNGSMPKKIEKDILNILKKTNKPINITVSIDGLEKLHDKIRGTKGSFQNCLDTLNRLCKLKKRYKNLNVGVISTITTTNQNQLKELFDTIHKKFKINQFQLNFLRGKPREGYTNKKTLEIYKKLNSYIHRKLEKKRYNIPFGTFYSFVNTSYKDLLFETVKKNRFIIPCFAGDLNGVIYANMDVFPCELREDLKMGNLKNHHYNIKKIWKSKKAKKIREEIIGTRCFCTFECQLTTNVLFNKWYLLKSFFKKQIMKMI